MIFTKRHPKSTFIGLVLLVCIYFPGNLIAQGEQGHCELLLQWSKGQAIKIEKALSFFPSNQQTLSRMHPGAGIGFSILASDTDILIKECGSLIETEQIADIVNYQWEIVQGGEGSLIGGTGNSIIYILPSDIAKNSSHKARIRCHIEASGKGPDDSLNAFADINIKRGEDCYPVYDVSITTEPPVPGQSEAIQEQRGYCMIQQEWFVETPVTEASLDIPSVIAYDGLTLLETSYADTDKLIVTCMSRDVSQVGFSKEEKNLADALTYKWDSNDGDFPLGKIGNAVIYHSPMEVKQVNILLVIEESGTQINDGVQPTGGPSDCVNVDLFSMKYEDLNLYYLWQSSNWLLPGNYLSLSISRLNHFVHLNLYTTPPVLPQQRSRLSSPILVLSYIGAPL